MEDPKPFVLTGRYAHDVQLFNYVLRVLGRAPLFPPEPPEGAVRGVLLTLARAAAPAGPGTSKVSQPELALESSDAQLQDEDGQRERGHERHGQPSHAHAGGCSDSCRPHISAPSSPSCTLYS